jgi:hypothetical protein
MIGVLGSAGDSKKQLGKQFQFIGSSLDHRAGRACRVTLGHRGNSV